MKFSENWLRQHVKTDASRETLAATLTAIGLEVEELTVLGATLDGVVVARIVECAKHPEADRLQVCQVDTGQGALLQIVCGAPNARPGLLAPLATIGTKVGELTIKAAKLRNVASNGMLCSAKELGIDADASGLLAGSPAWSETDEAALRHWCAAFLDWMRTSKLGRAVSAGENNQGRSARSNSMSAR